MRPWKRAAIVAIGLFLAAAVGLGALPRHEAVRAQGQPGEPPSACGVRITETAQSPAWICAPLGVTVHDHIIIGREGPHYTVMEMTEERVVTIATKGF